MVTKLCATVSLLLWQIEFQKEAGWTCEKLTLKKVQNLGFFSLWVSSVFLTLVLKYSKDLCDKQTLFQHRSVTSTFVCRDTFPVKA